MVSWSHHAPWDRAVSWCSKLAFPESKDCYFSDSSFEMTELKKFLGRFCCLGNNAHNCAIQIENSFTKMFIKEMLCYFEHLIP